ncbi:MAG TPA: LysE family transporter [Solimonas sp.]|nr:LysE family transporter [Solimonas sp.]
MLTEFLWKGLAIGLSIAAPVGPIGLLTIRRTLAQGWRCGFATGLGAAVADAAYGAVAAFGLTAVASLLAAQQFWLRLVGGVFLLWLGLRTFRAAPASDAAPAGVGGGVAAAFASALFLTLTNPMTIMSFIAVFAGLGLGAAAHPADAALTVLGVFAGSALWWLVLSSAVVALRERVTPARMRWVNRLSGALLLGFGGWALLQVA